MNPRALFFVATVVALACAPTWASAQDEGKAKAELIDLEAQAAYDEGRYAEALLKWKETYAAYPNAITAWNIARCYEELGELSEATKAFELFLGYKVGRDERRAAQDRIKELDERLKSDRRALELRAAGKYDEAIALWRADAEAQNNPHAHKEIARTHEASGDDESAIEAWRTYASFQSLTEAEREDARFRIEELEADTQSDGLNDLGDPTEDEGLGAETAVEPEGPDAGRRMRVLGWTLAGLSGALVTTGLLIRIGMNDDIDEIEELSATPGGDRVAYDELKVDIENQQTWMLIALSAGAATAAGSAVLLWLGYQRGGDEGSASAGRVTLSPWGAGALLEVGF